MPEPTTAQPLARLAELGVIPVVEIDEPDDATPLAEALAAGGLPIVEITFRTKSAAPALAALRERRDDILLAAGTVTEVDQVAAAVAAGADLLVAPGTSPWVLDAAAQAKIPMIPGVSTPSDIERALHFGMTTVKLFPAEALGGMPVLSALCGPYPHVRWVPTGGITPDSLVRYLAHPAVSACGGSWIAPRAEIAAGCWEAITARAREARAAVREARR